MAPSPMGQLTQVPAEGPGVGFQDWMGKVLRFDEVPESAVRVLSGRGIPPNLSDFPTSACPEASTHSEVRIVDHDF